MSQCPHEWGFWYLREEANLMVPDYHYRRDCQLRSCRTYQVAEDLVPSGRQETREGCDHDWVDLKSEAVISGLWCRKCNAVKADDR